MAIFYHKTSFVNFDNSFVIVWPIYQMDQLGFLNYIEHFYNLVPLFSSCYLPWLCQGVGTTQALAKFLCVKGIVLFCIQQVNVTYQSVLNFIFQMIYIRSMKQKHNLLLFWRKASMMAFPLPALHIFSYCSLLLSSFSTLNHQYSSFVCREL